LTPGGGPILGLICRRWRPPAASLRAPLLPPARLNHYLPLGRVMVKVTARIPRGRGSTYLSALERSEQTRKEAGSRQRGFSADSSGESRSEKRARGPNSLETLDRA